MPTRLRPGSESVVRAVVMAAHCLVSSTALAVGARATTRASTTCLSPCTREMGMASRRQAASCRMSTETQSAAVSAQSSAPGEANTATKRRVVSGVQPTGNLHLGNYLGAIKQWEANQDERENFFFVVDMHAITVPQDPKKLSEGVISAAATYLAAGIDPGKSKMFVQSHVSAHAEMTWLLGCATPLNWLERMIQYKEKKVKQGENVGVGLLTYPVLMAADVLLYQPDLVPVGEDQRQHLELARDIARRFNDQFCKRRRRVFKDPQALIGEHGARVMSLTDGRSKMSKSDPVEGSRINLTDSPDVIRRKLKRCKTDNFQGLEWDNPERPECTNLLTIYQAVTGKTKDEVAADVGDMTWGQFKPLLAEATVEHLEPFQARYRDIMQDRQYLNKVLRDGAESADEVASQTLQWAKEAMGFATLKDIQ